MSKTMKFASIFFMCCITFLIIVLVIPVDKKETKADDKTEHSQWVEKQLNKSTTTMIVDIKKEAICKDTFKHVERKYRIENKDLIVYFTFKIDGKEKSINYKVKYPSDEIEILEIIE